MSADGGAAESERARGDPTLAIRYVTPNLATQITFEHQLITTRILAYSEYQCCLAYVYEAGVSSISRLRPHGHARLVVKNEAVVVAVRMLA